MAKYKKRPVVIEAVQFDPQKHPWPDGVLPWSQGPQSRKGATETSWGYIQTLEGKMDVIAGDWIITGVAGEHYPCKDHIFKVTYDLVEE